MRQRSRWGSRVTGLVLAAVLGLMLGSVLSDAPLLVSSGQQAHVLPADKSTPPAQRSLIIAVQAADQPGAAPVDSIPGQGAVGESEPVGDAASSHLPTSQPPVKTEDPTPVASPSQRVTVLVIGIDNRPDEPVGRTDTMMVLTLDPRTGSTGLISLARDLLVPIPRLGSNAKINAAYFFGEVNKYPGGGPALARQTVSNFLGQPVDYWLRIDFDGFRQIIDQIGGIDIDVPTAINDPYYPDNNYGYDPLYVPAGRIHMDGTLALKYARTRHVDSDYGRVRRQQQVVRAVRDKLMQPGQLAALLPRLPGLVVTLGKSVQTDMPITKMIEFAHVISQANLRNPTSVVIDDAMGIDSNDATWGFVLIPDMQKVRTAVARVFSDRLAGWGGNAAADLEVLHEAARIAVLEGPSQKGMASQVATTLSAEGYRVVGVGHLDNQDYSENWLIDYGGGAPATLDALARRLAITSDHIIRLESVDAAADLAVILGTDLK